MGYYRLKDRLSEFGKVRFLQLLKHNANMGSAELATKRPKVESVAEDMEEEEVEEGEEDEGEEEKGVVTARCRFIDAEVAIAAVEGLRQNAEVQGAQVDVALLAGA